LALKGAAIAQGDFYGAGAVYHVGIGENATIGIEDKPRPGALFQAVGGQFGGHLLAKEAPKEWVIKGIGADLGY